MLTRYSASLRLPPYCATLRLPTLGYTFDFPFGHALSRGCSLPVDFATLHPSGCLRQSFSLRSIILPFRAPCGSLIRRFQLLTLAGLLMQSFSAIASNPERLPKPPGSREPLSCSSLRDLRVSVVNPTPRAAARLKTAH